MNKQLINHKKIEKINKYYVLYENGVKQMIVKSWKLAILILKINPLAMMREEIVQGTYKTNFFIEKKYLKGV